MLKEKTTLDQDELKKFEKIAADWWNPQGKFSPLHKLNPTRIAFIRDTIIQFLKTDPSTAPPFKDMSFLDIGCGGGLVSEPITRLGGHVVGIDPIDKNIKAAQAHAYANKLVIDYRITTAEELSKTGQSFNNILALEVIEHVRDPELFLHSIASMLKPNGLLFVGTINRTIKSFLFAILAAEYILRWLPRGTHQHNKLIQPEELQNMLEKEGLQVIRKTGITWNIFLDTWYQTNNTDMNYIMVAKKPK